MSGCNCLKLDKKLLSAVWASHPHLCIHFSHVRLSHTQAVRRFCTIRPPYISAHAKACCVSLQIDFSTIFQRHIRIVILNNRQPPLHTQMLTHSLAYVFSCSLQWVCASYPSVISLRENVKQPMALCFRIPFSPRAQYTQRISYGKFGQITPHPCGHGIPATHFRAYANERMLRYPPFSSRKFLGDQNSASFSRAAKCVCMCAQCAMTSGHDDLPHAASVMRCAFPSLVCGAVAVCKYAKELDFSMHGASVPTPTCWLCVFAQCRSIMQFWGVCCALCNRVALRLCLPCRRCGGGRTRTSKPSRRLRLHPLATPYQWDKVL